MKSLLIPYYSEGFEIDWTKTIPLNFDDIAMYIHPRVALSFEKIWAPETQTVFSIGHLFESTSDLNCSDFNARVELFRPFKTSRVERVFGKRRKSIFFDDEEVEVLASIFKQSRFTAIVNIWVDGEITDVRDIPAGLFKAVAPVLKYYRVILPVPADEVRKSGKIVKVKIVKENKAKGGVKVTKTAIAMKLAGGLLLAGGAALMGVLGVRMLTEGVGMGLGNVREVMFVTKDME